MPVMDLPMLLSGGMCIIVMLLNFISPILRRNCRRNAPVHIYSHSASDQSDLKVVKVKSSADSAMNIESNTMVKDHLKKEIMDKKEFKDDNSKDMIAVDAVLYIVPILLIYAIYAISRGLYFKLYDDVSESTKGNIGTLCSALRCSNERFASNIEWITCLFSNSYSWEASCGLTPDIKPSVFINTIILILYTGNSIIVAPFYFLNEFGLPLFRMLWRGKKDDVQPTQSSSSYLDAEILAGTPQVSKVSNNADTNEEANRHEMSTISNNVNNNVETMESNHGMMLVEPLAIVSEGQEEEP